MISSAERLGRGGEQVVGNSIDQKRAPHYARGYHEGILGGPCTMPRDPGYVAGHRMGAKERPMSELLRRMEEDRLRYMLPSDPQLQELRAEMGRSYQENTGKPESERPPYVECHGIDWPAYDEGHGDGRFGRPCANRDNPSYLMGYQQAERELRSDQEKLMALMGEHL